MSKETRTNSSDISKSRLVQYSKLYTEAWPEPDMSQQKGSAMGAQKTALKRQQRYNDKSTTQTTKPVGK